MTHPHQRMRLTVNWAGQPIHFRYRYEACKQGYRGALLPMEGLPLPDTVYTASSLGELEQHLVSVILEVMER